MKPDLETVTEYGEGEEPDKWHRLQIDRNTGELYWNDEKLITEKRFSTFERGLAVGAPAITAIGVAAAVVQAWAAVAQLHYLP